MNDITFALSPFLAFLARARVVGTLIPVEPQVPVLLSQGIPRAHALKV
jgi:hypothetical protein